MLGGNVVRSVISGSHHILRNDDKINETTFFFSVAQDLKNLRHHFHHILSKVNQIQHTFSYRFWNFLKHFYQQLEDFQSCSYIFLPDRSIEITLLRKEKWTLSIQFDLNYTSTTKIWPFSYPLIWIFFSEAWEWNYLHDIENGTQV